MMRKKTCLLAVATFLLVPHQAAFASACLDRLLESIKTPTDVSGCNLLSLNDGRIIAVRAEHGLFLQTRDGATSTHYFIDLARNEVEARHFARRHTYPLMDTAQPDAKQYYYPFYAVRHRLGKANAPTSVRFVCPGASTFSARSDEGCPR